MKKSDFNYHLPTDLIAQYPTAERTASRLLMLTDGQIAHRQFTDLIDYVEPGDLLVFNNTEVIPARIFARKVTGGQCEILVERILSDSEFFAHVRASKAPKEGTQLILDGGVKVVCQGREGDLFTLKIYDALQSVISVLEENGHMPLPPYIAREDTTEDANRYQTVYAKHKGAVAAPTAGLHFDQALLDRLQEKGVEFAYVTLHVGAGTFQPVRVDDIKDHHMHAEYVDVSLSVCEQIKAAKKRGCRVVAIGTTSVRCLETASQSGDIKPYQGDTDIFIYPGYQFQCVDALLTNFHLPESTLLMLVSAFAGSETIKTAYQAAIAEEYRFFSYGDAMFIVP